MFCKKTLLKLLQNSQKNVCQKYHFFIKLQGGNLKMSEATTGDVLWNKVFLKHSQISLEKTCVVVSFWLSCSSEDLFSHTCAFLWNFFKNNYFEEHVWRSVSKLCFKRDSSTDVFLWILWIIQEHLFCRGSTNSWLWNASERVSL